VQAVLTTAALVGFVGVHHRRVRIG